MNQASPPVLAWDPQSHHPLGGGSYTFKEKYAEYLDSLLPEGNQKTVVNISFQPNASPHIGTLTSLVLTFAVACRLKKLGREAVVICDMWDQAKGEKVVKNNVVYQRSLRTTERLVLSDYFELLENLGTRYGVPWEVRFEEKFLKQKDVSKIIHRIITHREELGRVLSPSSGILALRAPCPACGLVDKYAINNVYSDDGEDITFKCPDHGSFTYNIHTDVHKLQFNCQLWNLVIGRYYETVDYGYIEICGSDYAGFWQEQLLWRHLSKPILIVYTPLICDWSGAKISKSWYVSGSAYKYLCENGQEYLLTYQKFVEMGKDIGILCDEVEKWIDEPFRLFRGYSIHYMHLLFSGWNVTCAAIHTGKKKLN